jgi:hypothetical protein
MQRPYPAAPPDLATVPIWFEHTQWCRDNTLPFIPHMGELRTRADSLILGAIVGGLTSLSSTWPNQHAQIKAPFHDS